MDSYADPQRIPIPGQERNKRKYNDDRGSHAPNSHKKQRPENARNHAPSNGGHSQGSSFIDIHNTPTVLPRVKPLLPPIAKEFQNAVFTHSSIVTQDPGSTTMVNYERLEFLGDAQIEHIASITIFERYPFLAPNKMSSIREQIVRNEVLAQYARFYEFDKRIRSAKSHVPQTSGRDWTKIHADVFEAYVAAIILSSPAPYHEGFETATKFLTALWEPKLILLSGQAPAAQDAASQIENNTNPGSTGTNITAINPLIPDIRSKEELAKLVIIKGVRVDYKEEKPAVMDRRAGTQMFFMGVYMTGWGWDNEHLGSGSGESKGAAGQAAAKNALAREAKEGAACVLGKVRELRKAWMAENEARKQREEEVKQDVES